VHGLTPRHRRKAGSGPPASALIAWIGVDPHLRNAVAAAARRRRETALPPPANTRAARAAVAACFVLVCGTVLGVTATVNEGLLVPRKSSTPPLPGQHNAAAPDRGAPSLGPIPVVFPTPVAMAPRVVNPQTLQPVPAPPTTEHPTLDNPGLTPDNPGRPHGNIRSSAPTPPDHSVAPLSMDKPRNSPTTTEALKSSETDKSGNNTTQLASGNPSNTGNKAPVDPPKPTNPAGNPREPSLPSSPSEPGGTANPIVRGATENDGTHSGPGKTGVSQPSPSLRIPSFSPGSTSGHGATPGHN